LLYLLFRWEISGFKKWRTPDLESFMQTKKSLSHINPAGQAMMVDVGAKPETRREAIARGRIVLQEETLRLLQQKALPKGNAIEAARLAGIIAAKRTGELIPLCHPLGLDFVDVRITPTENSLEIEATARSHGQTGVEMEALTAVSVAALTLYDMCKAVDKMMVIGEIRLEKKSGGRSGNFVRPGEKIQKPQIGKGDLK
jgi:cyclic pyranopterin phosphate synthase